MRRHPHFDLWIHDDDELSTFIGSRIIQRATLHEWPLSCVQRLQCASGISYIYKAQSQPTVEPAFYQQARSPLVVAARVVPGERAPAALLLEDARAPHLKVLTLDEPTKLIMVDEVLTHIARIAGELPAVNDIRTPAQWLEHVQAIIGDLRALAEAGTFQQANATLIDKLAAHARSPVILAAFEEPTGYVHQDLRGENVLVLAGGYRVLDWQRPIWGPVALDRASLLESLGIDPAGHISSGVLQLRTLLRIGWAAQCARHWFPPGAATYDREIAQAVRQLDG